MLPEGRVESIFLLNRAQHRISLPVGLFTLSLTARKNGFLCDNWEG
jgi:hypothetical protein